MNSFQTFNKDSLPHIIHSKYGQSVKPHRNLIITQKQKTDGFDD